MSHKKQEFIFVKILFFLATFAVAVDTLFGWHVDCGLQSKKRTRNVELENCEARVWTHLLQTNKQKIVPPPRSSFSVHRCRSAFICMLQYQTREKRIYGMINNLIILFIPLDVLPSMVLSSILSLFLLLPKWFAD